MEYRFELVQELSDKFSQILESIEIINTRIGEVKTVDELLSSAWGVTTLDACLMRLQVMGELVNAIDRKTNGELFKQFPSIPWRNIIGLRNIISHEYSNIDYDIIWSVITKNLPKLQKEIKVINSYLNDLI